MTSEQCFSAHIPSYYLQKDKHPKDFLEIEHVEGWDILGGLYKEIAFIKRGMQDWENERREKNTL